MNMGFSYLLRTPMLLYYKVRHGCIYRCYYHVKNCASLMPFSKEALGFTKNAISCHCFFILMYPFLLSTPFRPKKNVILDINLDKCLSRFIPRIVLFLKTEVVGCKNCSHDFFETIRARELLIILIKKKI